MIARTKIMLEQLLLRERSPKKIALAWSLATYIAFCPFIGLHTIMLLASGWLFRVNIPLLVTIGYIINNPWTMIPIFASGYTLGYALLHNWIGIAVGVTNPEWMTFINKHLQTYVGITEISFWAFMVGANILGLALAFISYPIAYKVARTWSK